MLTTIKTVYGEELFTSEGSIKEVLELAVNTKIDLSYANNLNNANLRGANLRYAKLPGANLIGTNLRYAKLPGAELSDADLSDADLRDVNFRYADLSDACLINADLRGVDFTGANLRGANFRGADLSMANFTDANLTGVGISNANTTMANFENAKVKGNTLLKLLSITNIGSRTRTLAVFITDKETYLSTGCKIQVTLEEFIVLVDETHKDNEVYRNEYTIAISSIKSLESMYRK